MSEPWKSTTIRQCLAESFAGEWGSDPKPGNTKVLRATDIDDDGRVIGPGAVRQLPIGKLTSKRLLDGDILLEGSGGGPGKPVGRVAYFEANDDYEVTVCSNFFKTLRPKRSEVEPRFLLRKLAWFYKQPTLLTLQQQTTGIINLKFEEYLSAQIEIPKTVSEQQELAEVLDTVDITIHETEAVIAKLKAIKQGLLHDLLTRGINTNGELRPPQAEAPHLYSESPLGWVPKEWNVSGLAAVTPRDRSVIRTGPFGSSLKGEHWRESGRPVVTIGSLGEGKFIASDLLFVDEPTAVRLVEFSLIPGDVVFSRVADVGRSVVISENERGWIMSSNFMRISCDSEKVRPHFLQLLLSSSALIRKQLRTTVNSAGRDVANSAVLMGLYFPWPSPPEQDEILSKAQAMSERLVQEEAELKKLFNFKAGLMDDLLTGRVRVKTLLAEATQ